MTISKVPFDLVTDHNHQPRGSAGQDHSTLTNSFGLQLGVFDARTLYQKNALVYTDITGTAMWFLSIIDDNKANNITNTAAWIPFMSGGGVVVGSAGAWEVGTAYTSGDIVSYNGTVWIATASSTGEVPYVGSTFWTPVTGLIVNQVFNQTVDTSISFDFPVDDDKVVVLESGGAGTLTIASQPSGIRKLTVNSPDDINTVTFTAVGFDEDGAALTATATGVNNSTVVFEDGGQEVWFSEITSITSDGAYTNVIIGEEESLVRIPVDQGDMFEGTVTGPITFEYINWTGIGREFKLIKFLMGADVSVSFITEAGTTRWSNDVMPTFEDTKMQHVAAETTNTGLDVDLGYNDNYAR